MTGPVTVSITRRVDPSQEDQMLAWLRAGTELAERFAGFLGSGWVRPTQGSSDWHMLYRFASPDALEAWELSAQRRWWLDSAQGFVAEASREHRTGIEGWFDEPSSIDVQDLRPAVPPPPRWKQMCSIFIVFFPLSLVANELGRIYLSDWWLPARVLLTVCLMTPLMTYVLLPWITRLLAPWLHKARA
ncbi:antibiotic biosynthesis monooxygenase [Aeromicrobium endophyticum]|uniref:Antibiotic biosynthesis monooxygenase n=1 Tax=Aeromicrobium endophyticum TaxID=2292704 RepID=A0A371P9J0_9ACTN|nr:antibiotic biosynthesis monooxygenase [Aeromicrobium endophyticum]REK72634.1 antibiotic biosynthesis monooxygenase [Aeromicrobium endophyticum]